MGSISVPLMPDQTPDKPSSAARLKASKAFAGRCTARFSAPESENIPVWLGGTYVYSDRPTREKLPTTCEAIMQVRSVNHLRKDAAV